MLQRAARNAYSWWWASHVRTKQSKWLDQNLQDMEEKVEYILKIIDEDGDTFRQRAEMYYRKRPEIVNFVEDAFRGYRALAERYDHLSKELQSANRAIATVYPERVPFEMDENDDFDAEKFSAMALPSGESNMRSKNPPAAPKLNIPKIHNVLKKNSKAPTRLMSKKGLLKINAGDDAVPVPSSGLNKSEALQRIDKLQKDILALQTEKEFVKSSYESRLEKYWDIEKRITEMQGEVSDLQDEFGIGMAIDDDEARTLMTASAIKSCQETLTRLQQKQEQAAEDARVEFQKIQEVQEKSKRLKQKLTRNQTDQREHLEEKELLSPNLESNKWEQEEGCAELSIHDLETLHRKIKEELQANLGNSLTMSELAEKVDELVDKVIVLENEVSSQNAYVRRLRSEANELHTNIQSLEEEKEMLIDGSISKINKIRKLEEELQRVQSLIQSIKQQNNHLQYQFIQASFNLDEMSAKLLNVKPDEEDENITWRAQATGVLGVNPVKKIQLQEVATTNNVPEISESLNTKVVEQKTDIPEQNTCNVGEQKNLAQTISSYLQNHKVMATSDTNRELGVPAIEVMITPGRTSVVSDGGTVLEEVNGEGIIDHSNSSKAEATNNDDLSNKNESQVNFTTNAVLNMKSEEWFSRDGIVCESGSVAMKDMVLQEQGKEHNLWDSSTTEKNNDKSLFQSSQRSNINNFHRSQARATPECSASSEREKEDVILSNQGNYLDNQQIKHPSEARLIDVSERGFKEQHNDKASCDLLTERDTTAEAPKDDFFLSNRRDHRDIYSPKGLVGDLLDINQGKSDKSRDSIVPAESIKMKYKGNKGEIPGLCTSTSAEESHSRSQRRHSGNDLCNTPIKGPGEAVLRDGSEGKSDESKDSIIPAELVEMKDESKQGEILGHSNIMAADKNNSRCQGNLSGQTVIDKNTGMEEEKNDSYTNLNPVKPSSGSGHPTLCAQPNDLLAIDQARSISETSQQQKGFNRSENIADPGNLLTVSRDVEMVEKVKQNSLPDQGNDHQLKKQNVLLTPQSDVNTDELDTEEDDEPNWRELLLSGLDDREKILLQEYTSILRNYKETRKKLNEVEKKKRASLFQYCVQIKVLKSANAIKDAEIQSLQKKLNLFQENQDQTAESKERETTVSFQVCDDQSLNRDQKELQDLSGEATYESTDTTEESTGRELPKISHVEEDEGLNVINVDESPKFSIIEDKIRADIDELLEENIEFWMRFSTSFHQIQKFQTTVLDLRAEIAKLKENKQKGGITNHQSLSSDIRPIYRHLREIQTELTLWLDHNVVIKDDLENRLSSLSSMQGEITRLSNAVSKEEVTELDDYQAAKFQGEVQNMKQENNKIADELQSGLERVKNLQTEIEKTLKELDNEFDVSVKSQQSRYTAVRSKIPLRSFLFGVKLKRQKKPSFFACMSPALQKQHSDLTALPM